MMLPPSTEACTAVSPITIIDAKLIARRRQSILRQILSPEAALHQSVVTFADQAVVSATNFLTGVIIARACSKQELGLYTLGFSLITMITDLQTSLITTPYMVYAPRLKGRAHALYTGSALIHQLAFCLIAALVVMVGAFAVSSGLGPKDLGPVLRALALVLAFMMLREHARRISFAQLKIKAVFVFDTSIAIVQIGCLFVLARLGVLSASRAYWVVGVVCGIAVLGWLWSDRDFYDVQINESLADLKVNWALGKWVSASGLLWALAMNLYPWLLAAFHGVASTGVWTACLGVVSLGNPILKGVQNLAGPKIAHGYAAKGPEFLHRIVPKITVFIAIPIAVLCVGMFMWGGRLLTLLYGREYSGNGLVVGTLALNLFVGALAFSFSRALFALGRARLDFAVNIAALVMMVTFGLWLVRDFGLFGAALGLLGANLVASAARASVFLGRIDI